MAASPFGSVAESAPRRREKADTSRARSAAQTRALARLAREFPDRYAQLYSEEREVSAA